ncbi:Protein of unknown function (DUF2795) [Candidatus Nitrososphaera evergladensis SR1]|uniref:C2H2-type domain-containing protein n=1 Tax=Candidatus Nitrososphaera evergladensis SR1 TaxID=1459636 RepID=A0A075MN60_9ARCH|nr:DUF2795 domain-containing protein [Candidatus Nitrososphaera evergladensis]AIF82227.1 Protein of unknown function (DUF2795) [Candidatus Nitrososphaera evergladensis SR1]
MAQFKCEICGDGFEQKSRFERHLATAHPDRAPSAADLEKALSGVQYPKTKEELLTAYASQQVSDDELRKLVESLPSRTYRDAAEVAIALGEVKKKQGIRSASEVAESEAPSARGGRTAASTATSAAAVAKALSGVDFPKRKDELKEYAQRHILESGLDNPKDIVDMIGMLPDKEYHDMSDVEKSLFAQT